MITPTPFYFIRHGETDFNRLNRYMGRHDIPLNSSGETQAKQAALLLKNESIKHIATSPLLRATQTAGYLAEALQKPVMTIEGLQEMDHGVIEGEAFRDSDFFERWLRGETPEGAESVHTFDARVKEAINQALMLPGPVLIVSHGGVYMALRRLLKSSSLKHMHNCAVFHHHPPEHLTHPWIISQVGRKDEKTP